MIKRSVKVTFGKAGNGMGAKISLSIPLLKRIGVIPENREVLITYSGDKIILEKSK